MQRNHVAFLYQLIESHIVIFFAGEFIVGENFHSEALANIDKNFADFTRTHYAHRFAVQIETAKPV